MKRKFIEQSVVVASHNRGKVVEISKLLVPYKINTISAKELNLPEPKENGHTFIENAEIKARAASTGSGLAALADDSGLVIPVLGGNPGIFSSRWASNSNGPLNDFATAIHKIKHAIEKTGEDPERQEASFVCALSLCWPDGVIVSYDGIINGSLTFPPRGNKGFGYDPIFIPKNHQSTFGEMNQTKKHQISHRAAAFEKLVGHFVVEP
jgi:XTP/dITP diphosphohydrolase